MPTGITCGRCKFFNKVNGWGKERNGICAKYDYSVHSDSIYAQECIGYKSKKYKRLSFNYRILPILQGF